MTVADIWAPLAGGIFIGLAAVLLMALSGRIAGISGIVGGLLPPGFADDPAWRIAFVAGLIGGPLAVGALTGTTGIGAPIMPLGAMALAGVLVGVGTALGSGCTSGHGVCGTARLSPRSIAATVTFMAVAVIVVFLVRHII